MNVILAVWTALATSYCHTGCHTGTLTASGTVPHLGTVAAPRSLPFGTRLWIAGYGLGVVEDRGGAITAGRLDVWLPTCWQARQWGRRRVRVQMLGFVPLPIVSEPETEE